MLANKVLELSEEEAEILDLQQKLLALNVLGSETSEQLNLLRGWVISVHSDCEVTMDTIIIKKLYAESNIHFRKQGAKSFPQFKTIASNVIDKLAFMQKVATLFDMGMIGEIEFEDLRLLNKTRVDMAHPRLGKFALYENRDRQLWAYKLMTRVVVKLAEIDVSLDFPTS